MILPEMDWEMEVTSSQGVNFGVVSRALDVAG